MQKILQVENVTKSYGSREIIKNISLSINKGEIVGFLGPNGAGKTTTMRMISGFTSPTKGKIKILGLDPELEKNKTSTYVGYLPENPPLYDTLSVIGYLEFIAKIKGISNLELDKQISVVSGYCHLEKVINTEIYKLSKGYRQRLGIAQAIIGEPELLVLDEPTSGLDPSQIQETRDVISSYGKQHSVLISTHILAEVTMICDKIIIIDNGEILAMDTPENLNNVVNKESIIEAKISKVTDSLIDTIKSKKYVLDVKSNISKNKYNLEIYIENIEGIEAEIAKTLTDCSNLLEFKRKKPSLERVFLNYINKTN